MIMNSIYQPSRLEQVNCRRKVNQVRLEIQKKRKL